MTFFIALFILVMQFLWQYVDEMVGKGLEMSVLAELMLYAAVQVIPMALPLAILLSSLMTFGNLGENYELTAIKAAGISLQKIMAPLIILIIIISLSAFWFSNNMLPVANLKFYSLFYAKCHFEMHVVEYPPPKNQDHDFLDDILFLKKV